MEVVRSPNNSFKPSQDLIEATLYRFSGYRDYSVETNKHPVTFKSRFQILWYSTLLNILSILIVLNNQIWNKSLFMFEIILIYLILLWSNQILSILTYHSFRCFLHNGCSFIYLYTQKYSRIRIFRFSIESLDL